MPGSLGAGPSGVQAATHPLVIPFRVAAVVAAQLFDFATFMLMVGRHGIGTELNPLVVHGFLGFGMPMVALMKLVLVVLLGSTIVVLEQRGSGRRPVRGLAPAIAVLAVVAGLVGGISNTIVH